MNAGFVAFDYYRNLLQGEDGTISGPKTVIAGFGAGITESLLAVTPFESIKTTLCVPSKCPLGVSTLMRRLAIESMIGNQQNHGCVAFSTAQGSYLEKEGYEGSFKVLCRQLQGRPRTQPPGLEVIP